MAHELERLLKRNQEIAVGTLRKLQFYRLAVELEQMKEPSAREWFDMPWTPEPLSVRFVDNKPFKNACAADWQKRFPQDVCVALFVSGGEKEYPLFQCIHPYADIKDMNLDDEASVLVSPLALFSVNLSAAGDMDLEDLQIEALEKYLHETDIPTIAGLRQTLATAIGPDVVLDDKIIHVALSSNSPVLAQLVSELKKLGQVPGLNNVVADFLENCGFDNRLEAIDPDSLVALTPMDEAQRNAVAAALGSKVSVVTGPPGCGKTQVILNLLANAVIRGKSVLVSSKNNKAVDNVCDRLIRVPGLEQAIVRLGSRSVLDNQTLPGLGAMLTASQTLAQRQNACKQELAEVQQVYEAACKELTAAKKLINERTRLTDQLPSLHEAQAAAEAHVKEVEQRAVQEEQDFLDAHARYRVFDGYSGARRDGLVTPLRRARNTFLMKYAGLGRLWINWFTKRKHAALALEVVMALPPDIRRLIDEVGRLHSAEDARSGADVRDYYRAADAELAAGLDYLDGRAGLEARLRAEIEASHAAAAAALQRRQDCETRLGQIAEQHPDERFSTAKKTMEANAVRYVAAVVAKKLSGTSAAAKIATFKNHVAKGAPWSYKELGPFEADVRNFICVSPLMAITSLSAKGSLPLTRDLFDLLVIDEASQCDVASALPLMFRARQTVVIGDPQQLKHISADTLDEEKAIRDHLKLINVPYLRYAKSSLWDCVRDWLTQATGLNAPLMLNGHYRCHADIIEYSNRMFYQAMGGLIVRTPPFKNPLHEQGCQWIDVVGKQVSDHCNANLAEIDKAMEIATQLAQANPTIRIGIVTPFKAQAERIHDRIGHLPGIVGERITASTVHKFQGDERDVMIYSLVVTANSPATKINWIDQGARNLVNVAVTRARQALYVVGNKDYVRTHSSPARPLGALLAYIEGL